MTITVRDGDRVFRMPAFKGPDGMIVADPGGVKASKKLWQRTRDDFEERIKPKPFSPFQPFRTVGVTAR
jgi:hypothetical protein